MKRIIALLLILSVLLISLLGMVSCVETKHDTDGEQGQTPGGDQENGENNTDGDNNQGSKDECADDSHIDANNDDYCDSCSKYVVVVVDFYVLNDLHGKFCDTDTQSGIDELATYLKKMKATDDNAIFLASGDMWQGTAESNLTGGIILTEWMNSLDFAAMTLGNHDFDWGEEAIRENLEASEFPFLAINVYDLSTGKLADYCTPSIMIECDGIQVGVIGAIGDCYSSISADKVETVEFIVGNELAELVRDEAAKLRAEGADLIVYSLHDGYGKSSSGKKNISNSDLKSYYTPSLSNGVVDIVFEAHTHQNYTLVDSYGVYHVQGAGENKGISHVEMKVNYVNGENKVSVAEYLRSASYASMTDDADTEALEEKYADIIEMSYSNLGTVSRYYDDDLLEYKVAELYLEAGIEEWGDDYSIVLAGGFLRTRSPYNLSSGNTTYAELLSLFPFDNDIVLCSISGYKLKSKFIYTENEDYHNVYTEFGEDVKESVSDYETYYVVVDTYTALYASNGLTIIEYLDGGTYARDLLAEAIRNGEI